ncbi:response regulator [Conexibacter woesei]|uniref:response regulator n=1 Tax=Conexibacter woesei TaxID=191495 RepID=UPI000408B16D|nr:response regulator [Conexibacter woesei]
MARILIADDDARFRGLARRTVAARGHAVVGEAADAAAALALARTETPDVALVDVHLGADSGWALAAELRALGVPRVVMVSSDPDALHGAPDDLRDRVAFTPKPALAALSL